MKNKYMMKAIELAKIAENNGYIPIGAVIQCENHNFEGYNTGFLQHAELNALHQATNVYGNNLSKASIYITLEPCNMCLEALKLVKIKNIFFGTYRSKDKKHNPFIVGGIHALECTMLLNNFFKMKRKKINSKNLLLHDPVKF